MTFDTCRFQKSGLRLFLDILGLHRSGSKEEQIDRVLDFLLSPVDSGKSAPAKSMITHVYSLVLGEEFNDIHIVFTIVCILP